LRTSPIVLVAAALAAVVAFAPPNVVPAHAATGVKVVIIVGATHSATAGYRSDADVLYREAIKYTSNVVRVYSPSATAAKVKSAVAGASVVVYLGHGNGWPSPYTYDPSYTTKDGFGLNADLNGDGKLSDYENKYYGEPWIRDNLRPAPNAVVLFFHLCYASGNSEPGNADPSLSVAKQRVDNYGAAFLRAGFRAVVAIGHSNDPYYMGALFTTRTTIDDYFRNAPDANDNVASYASARTPGYAFEMDPDGPGDYYRSVVGKMSLRTQDITGAAYADTSADPATIVVPGNASPALDGAPVYGTLDDAIAGTNPAETLGTDVKVRVDARETATSVVDGSAIYRVHTDDAAGWMTAATLTPRDSAAPRVWEVDDGDGTFSPNGDGTQDRLPISIRLSEPADWTLKVRDDASNTLATFTGTSDTAAGAWSPAAGSVEDGAYNWTLSATDGWGNGPVHDQGDITVDTTPPDLSLADADGPVPQFTPNGDGTGDTVTVVASSSEPGSVVATVRDVADQVVDHLSASVAGGAVLAWDGKTDDGGWVPDGGYTLSIRAVDMAGNRSDAQARTVNVFGALGFVASSKVAFFPQDGDAIGNTTSFTFRLRSTATVDWTVRNRAGEVVRTVKAAATLDAGTRSFTWNGRTDAGALVPRGTYRSVVTATDGTFTSTQSVGVVADAFRITSSDTSPARGQRITITATSAEGLDTTPVLHVDQPGIGTWSVTMRKVDTRRWRVAVMLRSSATGTLRLRVSAKDSAGARQSSTLSLVIH
jgi:flagellar hook assembly protein FlgD